MFQLKKEFDVVTLRHSLLRRGIACFNQLCCETGNVTKALHIGCIKIFQATLQPCSVVKYLKVS